MVHGKHAKQNHEEALPITFDSWLMKLGGKGKLGPPSTNVGRNSGVFCTFIVKKRGAKNVKGFESPYCS